MSRSKNSRRGIRQKLPKFLGAELQEMRNMNIARIGAPKAGDARRLQGANDAIASEPGDPCCGSCSLDWGADFGDVQTRHWLEWKERQAKRQNNGPFARKADAVA